MINTSKDTTKNMIKASRARLDDALEVVESAVEKFNFHECECSPVVNGDDILLMSQYEQKLMLIQMDIMDALAWAKFLENELDVD